MRRTDVPLAGWVALGLVLVGCDGSPAGHPGAVDHSEPVAIDAAIPGATYLGLPLGLVDTGAPVVTPGDGAVGLLAIGMSNGRMEFDRYRERYEGHPDVAPEIRLVNCAQGGKALESWISEPELWSACADSIRAAGLDESQVRVIWAKSANQFTGHGRTLPDPRADYYAVVENLDSLVGLIESRFPSVQAIYHTSRSYGGYVEEAKQPARGEPISYEGGHAVNTLLRRWLDSGGMADGPWMGWGPYIWADGATPNGTGIRWLPEDFQKGGTDPHPTSRGQDKVAEALHERFSEFDWYRR